MHKIAIGLSALRLIVGTFLRREDLDELADAVPQALKRPLGSLAGAP